MSERKETSEWEPDNYDRLFPGVFLKCGHLGGKQTELFIERVFVKTIDEKPAAIIEYAAVPGITQVRLGLNKTNGLCLKQMFGPLMADWKGKRFVVHQSAVEHGRERGKPCIRVCASPDIPRDITVVIDFHTKMIKPFTIKILSLATAPASSRATELGLMIRGAATQESCSVAWEECKRDHVAMMLTDQELDSLRRAFAVQYKKLATSAETEEGK